MRVIRVLPVLLLLALGANRVAFAQFDGPLVGAPAPGDQTEAPANPAEQPRVDQSLPTFRSNVDVVNVFFNVKDKHGALIPNLKKEDFQISEDGKPQTIKYFSALADQPLTLGILIDSSASQAAVLPMEQEVGYDFLKQVVRPKDEAFVISFDVNVDLLQDYTNSTRLLQTALNSARINSGGAGGHLPGLGGGPFPTTNNPKGTLLYDAIYLASHDKLATEVGRKAMIVLTDGEDQGSQTRAREAVEAAQKADAICYVFLIVDRGFYGVGLYGDTYSGDSDMKKLTRETGGRMIEVGNKKDKLRKAFEEVSNELRSQYNIGYTPTNQKQDGSFRRVEIRVGNGDYKVQARNGYYARKGSSGGD